MNILSSSIQIEMMTTKAEDTEGAELLKEALRKAYTAGWESAPKKIPDEHSLWRDLMKVIKVVV